MDIRAPSDIDISPYLNQVKTNCDRLRSDVKSSRAVIVTIINHTNQILYRYYYFFCQCIRTNFHTSHGHWRIFPEEKINAHAFIHLVTESQGVLGGKNFSIFH